VKWKQARVYSVAVPMTMESNWNSSAGSSEIFNKEFKPITNIANQFHLSGWTSAMCTTPIWSGIRTSVLNWANSLKKGATLRQYHLRIGEKLNRARKSSIGRPSLRKKPIEQRTHVTPLAVLWSGWWLHHEQLNGFEILRNRAIPNRFD
jgi:hypothetical protein